MTITTAPRDDLFTHIHKALRLALFEITAQVSRTDWTNDAAILEARDLWVPVLALLRAHTHHEDDCILRILDAKDSRVNRRVAEEHIDLDDLLEDLANRFDQVVNDPNNSEGLDLYRDLARFVAAYLPHLHEEETLVMTSIWDQCSDEEIAATRAALMASMTPAVATTSLEYMVRALDPITRDALLERVGPASRA